MEIRDVVEMAARGIELTGVAIIVISVVAATGRYLTHLQLRTGGAYDQFKVRIGKAMLLGLEFLVAADIVETVVLEPTLQSVTVLAMLVLIRTFLSWSIVVEIEGRWPWQKGSEG
jgi:uncharacterized membrane protein